MSNIGPWIDRQGKLQWDYVISAGFKGARSVRNGNDYCHQVCQVFAMGHGRSLEYSCQCNVAPQQNTNVDSMQGQHAWQTRANRTHAQAWARHVQAGAWHERTKGTHR